MKYEEWGEFRIIQSLNAPCPNSNLLEIYADWTADREHQRRHRKWALKKARLQNQCAKANANSDNAEEI